MTVKARARRRWGWAEVTRREVPAAATGGDWGQKGIGRKLQRTVLTGKWEEKEDSEKQATLRDTQRETAESIRRKWLTVPDAVRSEESENPKIRSA